MRVGILGLLHESNTFIEKRTSIANFNEDLLLSGEAVRQRMRDSKHEVGGFFESLHRAGVEAVPLYLARAYPSGVIEGDCFDRLVESMMAEIDRAGPLDGILAAPHGATVAEHHPDADGAWLSIVRQRIGPSTPLIATIDPHANVSPQMVRSTDALLAYRTNPHLDQWETGQRAAELMVRTLRGEIRPSQAAAFPPMAINIRSQTTSEPPLRDLIEQVAARCDHPDVLSHNVVLGFPYADVSEMGSSMIVVTDSDPEQARQLAESSARLMWQRRAALDPPLVGIEQAIERLRSLRGRTLLLDMGDNVGGGSPADETELCRSLHEHRVGPAFVCLCDPEAVQLARAAGVGAKVDLEMGGKSRSDRRRPLAAHCHVSGLYDGKFSEPEVRHGGFQTFDQGSSAVVRTEHDLTVLLTSRRVPPFSLRQLDACGLDPRSFRVLIAKGVIAPLAAYGPICDHVIHVNTPGVTCADMRRLDYQRRRPMFPFNTELSDDVTIVTH